MNKLSNNIIAYTVDKASTNGLYISIQNGEVVVKAPGYLTREQIQEAIEEKKNWIINKLKEYNNEVSINNNIDPKSVKIFGDIYDIKISYKYINIPKLNIENKCVQVILPKEYKKADNNKILNQILELMYQKIANSEIELVMEKFRILLGIAPEDYEIKKMKNTLASCSKDKKISINPDIVKYSKKTIDYIILHEFCHLKFKTHTKGFYEMVKKYIPEYTEYSNEIGTLKY